MGICVPYTVKANLPSIHRLHYSTVRDTIADGDILLFRGDPLIAVLGRSCYSHAAMVVRCKSRLLVAEVREFYGGRLVPLSGQVRRYPGRIDVYKPDWEAYPYYNASQAADWMIDLTSCSYGYLGILRVLASRLPVLRWIFRPSRNDKLRSPCSPFCSWAVSTAARCGGGLDPVAGLADSWTEPGDLARGGRFVYSGTLYLSRST